MSDSLTRGFRTQLSTTIDSVLRIAVFEIMKIFENTVHDYQMELAHKGEEVTQLTIKLQTAELRLKDRECGGDRGEEMNKMQVDQMQREPEVVMDAPRPRADVPEIDFEVPDDWCAPLGCEISKPTKQDDVACPSVKLRPLSIPLWHVPVRKHDVANCDTESPKRAKDSRRSPSVSALNERHTHDQDKKLLTCDQEKVRNDMKRLLQGIKQESSDLAVYESLRSSVRKGAAVENDGTSTYSCKFCKKMFDTAFGRHVHERSHQKCRGCKKVFPLRGDFKRHKKSCRKLKRLLARLAKNRSKTSRDEGKTPLSTKKLLVIKKESTPSSSNQSQFSTQRNKSTKRYSCAHCPKKFNYHCRLIQHMCIHTVEKPFACSMCPRKYNTNPSLKMHMTKRHKNEINPADTNGDLAWTKPLEDIEDGKEDFLSPSKDTSKDINHKKVRRKRCTDMRPGWQTMGKRCRKGFTCLLCQKFLTNKASLIEHYHIHTGEKPNKCEKCYAEFRFRSQLYVHRRKCLSSCESIPV